MSDELDIPQNPRAFDVGALGNAGPAPGPLTPAPQPTARPSPPAVSQPQIDPAQAADMAHHYSLGKAVKSLFGQERSYSVDQDGKTVESETDAKPGQIFRHMVAGVLLGGAAAEKNKSKSFLGGLASGGGAAVENEQAQDQNKVKQAREDFKQSLEAKKDNREGQYASTQQDLLKAQISMHNAQTLRENQLIQKENFEAHEKTAAHGKSQLQPYIDANMPKAFDGVSESEMNELLKKNPNSANLLWEPTGTTVKVGEDGKPHEELTYSAVDPKGKIKVTDTQIKNWKDAGLDQVYGKQFFDVLKDGKELDSQQYMALTHAEQDFHNKSQERHKQDLDARKEESQIALEKAQAAHFSAEAVKLKRENKKDSDYDSALTEFNDPKKANGDFAVLSPKSKFVLGDHISKETDEIQKMIQTRVTAGQGGDEETTKLYKRWEMLSSIKSNIIAPKAPTVPAAASVENDAVKNIGDVMKQDGVETGGTKAFDYISNKAGMSPADRASAIKKYAVVPWLLVTQRAEQEGITRDKMAERMKAQGFKLEYGSDAELEKEIDEGVAANPPIM